MTHLNAEFESWIGRTLLDESGHKVGKIEDIYTDDDTGQPEWLSVTTGLFGSNVSFVPVEGASPCGDREVQVRFPKELVKDAPNAGGDGVLSPEEEARLYAHYGYDYDRERVRLQRWRDREPSSTSGPLGMDDPAHRSLGHLGTEPVETGVGHASMRTETGMEPPGASRGRQPMGTGFDQEPLSGDVHRRPMVDDGTVIHLEDSPASTGGDDPRRHGWDDDELDRPALADRLADRTETGGRTRRR
jgi:sporulation protein YlmC with PRC-barrel domain